MADAPRYAACLGPVQARSGRPTTDPGSAPKLSTPGDTMHAMQPTVLVVDDEECHLGVMALGLGAEGFDVDTAENAEQALEKLAARSFDVAVVDLMMPGINGIQLARMMRERYPQTRVVLMSAYHLGERQLVRVDCGAVGFVPKPFEIAELARFLRGKVGAPSEAVAETATNEAAPVTRSGAAA